MSTNEGYARGAAANDDQYTYSQKDHGDHDNENQQQTYRPAPRLALVLVGGVQLFGSTGGVDRDG